ncbi:glycosyltransferase [Cytobacillus sp. FJAT-54145]|uniref:Glycosyltransferase n=1 Tax=Cytobacillus spartinae TaxID=3299023 RepID=A0ABW6KHX0_9BACI
MGVSTIQLIVHSNVPVIDYINSTSVDKERLFTFTENFMCFLSGLKNQPRTINLSLAIPPIFYEIIDKQEFKEEFAVFLQKDRANIIPYQRWLKWNGNLIQVIRELRNQGKLDLLATPLTGAILPYISTQTGLQLQVQNALSILEDYFSCHPEGFWFPRGAYSPGLDLCLVTLGLKYSFIDSKTIHFADPSPRFSESPVKSPHGLIFYPLERKFHEFLINSNELMDDNYYGSKKTIALSLEEFCALEHHHIEKINELLRNGVIEMVTSKEIPDVETVHLCPSFLEGYQHSELFIPEQIANWTECHFIEKDIERLRKVLTDGQMLEIRTEMEKEWLLLVGGLSDGSNVDGDTLKKHVIRYYYLRNLLTKDETIQFSSLRQSVFTKLPNLTKGQNVVEGTKQKLLVLTWEYPPNVVGGLARHVHGLAEGLAKLDYEVHIITTLVDHLPPFERVGNVHIHRVRPLNEHDHDFIAWTFGLNTAMVEKVTELETIHQFELIHAHDWLVGAAALSLKERLDVPLITTIHATEYGRNQGIYTEMQKFIHEKERELTEGTDFIITCSDFMKNEVEQVFNIDSQKIAIIPNGINEQNQVTTDSDVLINFPIHYSKKMIFSIGRMVQEKGFDTLIEAAHIMRDSHSDLYFIIAGKGPMLEEYRKKVKELALEDKVFFVGFVSDEERNALLTQCEMAVFPSRYEPFGIVALESMLFAKPTIVSNVGGLKGIIQHSKTGLIMTPNSPKSFIEQVDFLLHHKDVSIEMGLNAKKVIESLFSWRRVAEETKRIFDETLLNCKI